MISRAIGIANNDDRTSNAAGAATWDGSYSYVSGTWTGPQWETIAMKVGPALPGGGIDPLFTLVFASATFVNILPALALQLRPTAIELGVIGVLHLAMVIRIVRARGAAARQRAIELESFRQIRAQK